MSLFTEQRLSDSPYVESVTQGWTFASETVIRPAECHWHMVLVKHEDITRSLLVGPLSSSGLASWTAGAELLWVKFKLGTFFPHMPTRKLLDGEFRLQELSEQRFWLKDAAWQIPDFENVDTFLNRLARQELLMRDPLVNALLEGEVKEAPSRTVRHRFLQATGMSQGYIRQIERAQEAQTLLRKGMSILDVVYQAGYSDQPHLTRSLKQFIGYTPAQIAHQAG
jgi:AraC-like DNA-binding protein